MYNDIGWYENGPRRKKVWLSRPRGGSQTSQRRKEIRRTASIHTATFLPVHPRLPDVCSFQPGLITPQEKTPSAVCLCFTFLLFICFLLLFVISVRLRREQTNTLTYWQHGTANNQLLFYLSSFFHNLKYLLTSLTCCPWRKKITFFWIPANHSVLPSCENFAGLQI